MWTLFSRDKHKEAAELKPPDFRVGLRDNGGEKIVQIYGRTADYVIYRTKKLISIDIDDERDKYDKLWKAYTALTPDIARTFSLLPENIDGIETINKHIVKALMHNLEGHPDAARDMLKDAEARIKKHRQIRGRIIYAISSMLFAALLISICITMRINSASALYREIYAVITCGILGGVLSVSLGFTRIDIDLDASSWLNFLVGASRILIAAVASIVAWFIIKADLAFGVLVSKGNPANHCGIFAIAALSGFSEYLVPNILRNMGSKALSAPPDGKSETSKA